jgi:hypothetical protein
MRLMATDGVGLNRFAGVTGFSEFSPNPYKEGTEHEE